MKKKGITRLNQSRQQTKEERIYQVSLLLMQNPKIILQYNTENWV